jgi:hypothetical protein
MECTASLSSFLVDGGGTLLDEKYLHGFDLEPASVPAALA